jgi:hypothetical protein
MFKKSTTPAPLKLSDISDVQAASENLARCRRELREAEARLLETELSGRATVKHGARLLETAAMRVAHPEAVASVNDDLVELRQQVAVCAKAVEICERDYDQARIAGSAAVCDSWREPHDAACRKFRAALAAAVEALREERGIVAGLESERVVVDGLTRPKVPPTALAWLLSNPQT